MELDSSDYPEVYDLGFYAIPFNIICLFLVFLFLYDYFTGPCRYNAKRH